MQVNQIKYKIIGPRRMGFWFQSHGGPRTHDKHAKTVRDLYGSISSLFWKVFNWFLEIIHAMMVQDSCHVCLTYFLLYISTTNTNDKDKNNIASNTPLKFTKFSRKVQSWITRSIRSQAKSIVPLLSWRSQGLFPNVHQAKDISESCHQSSRCW